MPKTTHVKFPIQHVTKGKFDKMTAHLKEHSGKWLDIKGPIAPAKTADKSSGPKLPKRRRRVVCRLLGPEEWGLVFGPSEYGGIVCYR
jgi:hypothetical protein